MGDAYGWTDNGRQVFDPLRLENAASELRQNLKPAELRAQLLDGLIPREAFGDIPGGADAYHRLLGSVQGMISELEKVGLDLTDLASRTVAAAQLAHEVDPATQAAARRGHSRAE
ncbi:hypothetical protein Dvina_16600 [Dactylosporangium vinaceum]|uniref:Uncharacterized protein n=1 Tax=Dactylosporangium vinaceum TaxID=53362 RepID=A0ABV5M9A0_9ACTN|nr:hypothetical protein [Dactylosporangium vinaceum]UAB99543.1 hypothetical protein Dvina_16600 [Dactylosporangium vinaceum]